MPLSDRKDYEDARYVGLAVISSEPLTEQLHDVSVAAGFDFLATPLASDSHKPRLQPAAQCDRMAFARQDMISLNGERAGARLLGLVSGWIDPDSEDPQLRKASLQAFKAEVEWSKFLGLQAIALPPPADTSRMSGYAQVLISALDDFTSVGLWVRLRMSRDPSKTAATWRWWDTLRTLCGYKANLGILLEVINPDDMPPEAFDQRWLGEPVRGVLIATTAFLKNKRQFPVLPRSLQAVVTQVYKLGQQVTLLVNGPLAEVKPTPLPQSSSANPTPSEAAGPSSSLSQSNNDISPSAASGGGASSNLFAPQTATELLRAHFDYLAYLFQKLPTLSGLSASGFTYRDHLQLPLQPLADNLDSAVYETFEKDKPKYEHYREALRQAIHDMHYVQASSAQSASSGASTSSVHGSQREEGTIHVAVLGAGRGPLVDAALSAADSVGVPVVVVAVEKNPCAVEVLKWRMGSEASWRRRVTLTAADMRSLGDSIQVHIVVSELLGSFGDNELSPECLEGVSALLRPGGVCIPASYTSYLAPVCTHAVHAAIRNMNKPERFEVGMVVRLWKHVVLGRPEEVFSFDHTERSLKARQSDLSRATTLCFSLTPETLPSTLHGFAGYFEAVLYKGVKLSTLPATHTPDMLSWFPIFFPLKEPVRLEPGSQVSMSIWRHISPTQVWYEWALLSPSPSKLHNFGGHAYSIKLAAH